MYDEFYRFEKPLKQANFQIFEGKASTLNAPKICNIYPKFTKKERNNRTIFRAGFNGISFITLSQTVFMQIRFEM